MFIDGPAMKKSFAALIWTIQTVVPLLLITVAARLSAFACGFLEAILITFDPFCELFLLEFQAFLPDFQGAFPEVI